MSKFTSILFLVFFSDIVFAQYNSMNNAIIPIDRVLEYSEAIELRYTVENTKALEFSHQKVGIEVTIQCENVVQYHDTHSSHYRYIVHLQQGTHVLYWYAQQFDCDIQSMNIRPIYIDNKNSIDISYTGPYISVPTNIFALESLAFKVQIRTMSTHVKPSSLYDMMNWRTMATQDNDYTVFRWQQHPQVLIFFFKNKQVQAKYLKRLAFFVEKRLTRGSIMYDEQIAHRKGWGAHNYTMQDIQAFFEKGRTETFSRLDTHTNIFPFHTEELDLKYILIEQDFLEVSKQDKVLLEEAKSKGKSDYSVIANMPILSAKNYMVSIALTYSSELIRVVLCHELLHTFYFHDELLQTYVTKMWNTLSRQEQTIWRSFFAYNGYDETYNYLVQNEFFAYLLQRPIYSLAWYLSSRIIPESKIPLKKDEIEQFAIVMEEIAQNLEYYMYENYGVTAGNVLYVQGE